MDATITKMATISLNHLTDKTINSLCLTNKDYADIPNPKKHLPLTVYNKSEYGYLVLIKNINLEILNSIPDDLASCILYAMDLQCDWIDFDVDGPEVSELYVY